MPHASNVLCEWVVFCDKFVSHDLVAALVSKSSGFWLQNLQFQVSRHDRIVILFCQVQDIVSLSSKEEEGYGAQGASTATEAAVGEVSQPKEEADVAAANRSMSQCFKSAPSWSQVQPDSNPIARPLLGAEGILLRQKPNLTQLPRFCH